jgi:hypothetical protein
LLLGVLTVELDWLLELQAETAKLKLRPTANSKAKVLVERCLSLSHKRLKVPGNGASLDGVNTVRSYIQIVKNPEGILAAKTELSYVLILNLL